MHNKSQDQIISDEADEPRSRDILFLNYYHYHYKERKSSNFSKLSCKYHWLRLKQCVTPFTNEVYE